MMRQDDDFQVALAELIDSAAVEARYELTARLISRDARARDRTQAPPNKRIKLSSSSSSPTSAHHRNQSTRTTAPLRVPLQHRLPPCRMKSRKLSDCDAPRLVSGPGSPRAPEQQKGDLPRGGIASGAGNTMSDAHTVPFDDAVSPGIRSRVVRRQWDSQHDLPYEALLEERRREKITDVDRYVPDPGQQPPIRAAVSLAAEISLNSPHQSFERAVKRTFPFQRLPEKVQARIVSLLLVKEEPILIDFTWLRPFINGHSRVPIATKPLKSDNSTAYSVPHSWNTLIDRVKVMQTDAARFRDDLEVRGNKTRRTKGPCRNLSTGLLRVSKSIHDLAAAALYGENAFGFPWPTCAWMQLESFLATIGSQNVSHLRSISVHVPLWYRGMQEDYVEGAIIDLTSPASRLGVVLPVARDRLLSAIESSVHALLKAGSLERLTLELEHGMTTDKWIGRHSNDRQLIPSLDAEEFASRKQAGIAALRRSSEMITPRQPTVTLHHPGTSSIQGYDKSELKQRLPGVRREAAKYGWRVENELKGRRW